ncbi:Ig-like domain-containing protein [Treponema porcinum]|uniref:Ig-like domain-containing protein n=1 Tax=Treponema porcinum TaxID=261392 RepID=UPI003F096712
MKKFLVCLPAVFFILLSVCILSCEVGLGESVDTEAPKISITYPDAKSVIKDKFVLAGECSDDRMVTGVQVTILDSENNPVTGYELKAPVVETGKSSQVWSVEINARNEDGSYPLKDGKYTFRTIATDGAGRKSAPFERDLEIDNTAPVFVINSPGSTETETSYGSVLKVEGSIAEAHSVKSMTLTVYNTDGTEKASWKEENINIAGGTSVTFAKYYSNTGGTDTLLDRYNSIYDSKTGGFQAFKCSVELTDSACVYQKPDFVPSYNRSSDAEETSSSDGNTTSDVWLYDDIYGTDAKYVLMGTKASEVWGKAFEVSDFMNILNGTVPYDTPNADGKTVLEVLNSAKTDTSATSLKMKLNKDANPTYTVMGYSFDSTAEKDGVLTLSPAAKGGTITFKADAGLDGVLFSPETIKVYLFGPFEKDAVSSKLSDIYNDPKAYAEKNAQVTSILYDGKNGVGGGSPDIYGPYTGESRSTWTQSLSLPSDSKIMKATKCYVIAATGEDKDNVEFISANNKYNGFEAQATGVPPSVTISEPKTDSISNKPQDILTIKGIIKSDEGTAVNDASYEIYVYDVTNNNTLLGTIKNRDTNSDDNGSMKITGTLGVDIEVSFEIDASKGTWYPKEGVSKDGTKPSADDVFKYVISVSGVTDTTGKDSVTAQVDMHEPTVSVEVSTLLSIEKDGKTRDKCVNGEITVKTSLSDNDKIAQSWIEITGASLSEPKKIDDRSSGVTNYSVPFDTTTINDGEYTVTVYAKDNAGNIGSSSHEIYVDQSTDLPVITLSNADKTFTGKPSLSSNLFGMGSNVIIGAVSDDDGISSIEYVIDKGTDKEISGTIEMSGKTPTSKSFQIDLTKLPKGGTETVISSGDHTLSIFATDISSGLENVSTPVKSSDETGVSNMKFGYDDDVPSLSVTTKSGVLIGENISYSITGTAGDGSGLKNSEGNPVIYRYAIDSTRNEKKYGSKEEPKEITVSEDGTWTDTIQTYDNGDDFEYCAIDEYERSTTAKFTFRIDSVNPTITLTNPSEDTVYIGETTLYSFRGSADDPVKVGETTVDSSGISGIEYTVYASDGTKIETKTVDSSTKWNININFSDYKKDDEIDVSKIEFRSVDGGGLKSDAVSKNIVIDKIAPEIKFTIDGDEKTDSETIYISKDPDFIFEVSDENLDFTSLQCSVPLTWNKTEETTNSVKYKITGFATDDVASVSKTYSFTAQDKAGRITVKTLNVYYDKEEPVIEEPSVSPIASKENDATEYVNGIIKLKGTVSDNDKVSSTRVILKQNDNDVTSTEGALPLVNNTGDRYEYTIDTTKLTDKTPLDIIIESTDRAGNVIQKTKTVQIDQDTDKPVLKFNNGDTNCIDENNIKVGTNLFGMGSNTLYINVSDDDGVKSVSLNIDGNELNPPLLTDGQSTTWSYSLDVSKYGSGVHSLKFTICDTEGKSVSYPESDAAIKIAYDDDVPEISVTKFNETAYTQGCFAPADFTLNGTVKDSSGKVTIYYTSTEVDAVENCETESQSWTHNISGETSGNNKTRNYIARDKYGRESSVTIKYNVDTIKPVFTSDYISISGETSAGSKTYNLNSYNSSDIWFTNSLFTVKGESSGGNKPVTEENNFTIQIKVGDDIVSTLQPGTNNTFSGTLDVGTTEAEYSKTITLTATDEAENISSPLQFTVNVDKDSPEITTKALYTENPEGNPGAQALTDNSFVNKNKIYFKYIVSDAVSGVSKVEVYKTAAMKDLIGSFTVDSPSKGNVEGIIEIDISSFESKEYDFYVKVTDKTGNTTSSDLVNFTFDKTAPTVTYSKPSENSNVNKTISIEGTISDLNPPALNSDWNWALKVKKPGEISFTDITDYVSFDTSLSAGSFKISGIDTTKIGEGNAEFLVIATDKAGNTISEASGKTLTLNINQDSDRPEISLSTISTAGTTTLSSGTITGTISDDDGVDKLEIQVVKKNSEISDSGWKEVTLNGSNWSYTYSDGNNNIDGDYYLYFRVNDKAGGTFTSLNAETSDATAKLSCPKINYSGSGEKCSKIPFSIDTVPPSINIVQYKISSDNAAWSEWTELSHNTIFGGVEKRYIKFRFEAHDTVTAQDALVVTVNISGKETFSTKDSTITLNISGDKYGDYYYFETNSLDAEDLATGSYTFSFDAKDKAEKPSTLSYQIRIDNTAPDSISIRNYSGTTELTGNIALNGLCSDETKGNSGVKELYYLIPKTSITLPENVAGSSFGEQWESSSLESSGLWEFEINSDNICEKAASGITLKDDFKGYETASNSGVFSLPLWFKIVDVVGNVAYKTGNFIRYNPDADKPRVSMTYPVHNVKDGEFNYVIMGGTVRFTGTAEDDEGIAGVYLQFDMNGDGIFENGENISGCPYDYASTVVPIPHSTSNERGVKANGTQSWNYSLKISNLDGLLYSPENKKTLNVRVVAVDTGTADAPLVGAWSEAVHISVNKDVPAFETVRLSQFDGSGSVIKTIDYEDDKFISGENWYLIGKISSNAGISEVDVTDLSGNSIGTISIDTTSGIQITDNNNFINDKTISGGNITELEYKIPVSTENRWAIKITVSDNSEEKKSNYSNYSLNIDNTPPSFYDMRSDSEISKYGTIKIYSGEYGNGGQVLSDVNKIQNSNGMFTLAGRTTEAGSGYENILFYFKRVPENITEQNPVRVYNPMKAHGATNKENRTDITESNKTDGKVYINSDGLPVLYTTQISINDSNKFEFTSNAVQNNDNVRIGGLVKIGGIYRKILSVNYSTGTVTVDSECETSSTEAEFVYAMVIDNSGESFNIDNSIKNDDGDGMVESYSKSGTNYTWDASIDSTHIPDGPIELHIVAFDKAGNSNHGYVKTAVSNNAPRIARVRLATDLNGNSTYEENEKQVFAYLETDTLDWAENTKSKGTEIWNLDGKVNGSVWTIKNNLQIEPEFVGGTAPFHYIFTKESGIEEGKNLSSPKTGSATGQINGNKEAFVIPNSSLDTSEPYEDKINTYQFSFWDSTEETTPCTDSQWTVLNVQLKQDIIDNFAPKVVVKPFFWNSASDNSLYKNSLDNGHIELEGDLDFENTPFTNADGEYDKDPKVSGKIVFRGTAYDDVRLSSLWIKFSGFTFNNYVTESGYGTNGTSNGYVQTAFYNIQDNSWNNSSATLESDGWSFETTDEYFDQKGHKVNWALTIDTARISTVTAVDAEFAIMAVDHVNTDTNKSSETDHIVVTDSGQTDTSDNVYNKPKYKVDVVPYITEVETSLSILKKKNPSVYTRTALGHYSVASNEEVTINGFNLDNYTVSISTISSSREFAVKVNNVESLNNKNRNDARGSYEKVNTVSTGDYLVYSNYYNRQPNNDNNNLLTDDIYFDIWQFDSEAIKPISGGVDQPVMKIDPKTGAIGMAFANGALYFSMGGTVSSETYSSQYWMGSYDFFTSVGFAYDDLGYSYGSAAGGDCNSSEGDAYCFVTSRWGIGAHGQRGSYDGANTLRLERISHKDSSGNITINKQRVKSPSFITSVHNTDYTNVYLAYYDDTNDEIRFKAGRTNSKSKGTFGMFSDSATSSAGTTRTENVKYVNLLAGGDTGRSAGEYVSLGVKPGTAYDNDVVVAVWYDSVNRCLKYAYNTNPLGSSKGSNSGSEWIGVETVFTDEMKNAGEYCQVIVDKDGGIHIAAYDPLNLDLVYAYKSAYDITGFQTCIVDGNGVVGTNLTLDVAKVNGVWTPYIGYYATSCVKPKLAYKISSGNAVSGTIDDMLTGAWECAVVPTSSYITLGSQGNNKMNVGVWKDVSTWELKNSITGTKKSNHSGSGYSSTCNDTVWGNGTKNPVMGYAIKISGSSCYIETAQLK